MAPSFLSIGGEKTPTFLCFRVGVVHLKVCPMTHNLKKIARKHLTTTFPLYEPAHDVLSCDISGGVWLGYRTTKSNQSHGTTHFDVNILGDVFFVLNIEVEKSHRGKGNGAALYAVLEAIAKEIGCKWVQMMPSGWTGTGETRENYLIRHGYRKFGIEVIKECQVLRSQQR